MSNLTMLPKDESSPEMDGLLRDYFQAKMPCPWPKFQAPKETRTRPTESVFTRYAGRLVLAVCVALLIAGYLTIAGFFPARQSIPGLDDVVPNIASKDITPKLKRPLAPNNLQQPEDDRLEPLGDLPNRPSPRDR